MERADSAEFCVSFVSSQKWKPIPAMKNEWLWPPEPPRPVREMKSRPSARKLRSRVKRKSMPPPKPNATVVVRSEILLTMP